MDQIDKYYENDFVNFIVVILYQLNILNANMKVD